MDAVEAPALEAILLPPKPIAAVPARPRPRPKPPSAPAPQPAPAPVPEVPEAPPVAAADSGETTTVSGAGTAGNAAAGVAGGVVSTAPGGASLSQTGETLRFSPAPPATLDYASFVNGVQNPDGVIRWQHDGTRYRLDVELRVLWYRFAFQSSGALGGQGLMPERYEESRRKRSEIVRFDRGAGQLVFESRGAQEPLPEGAQDRFSVFLQLVGLVRGNPQRYTTPGVTESFQVADTRDLQPMQVQYVGDEDVDTGQVVVRARHFVRLPRRADDRRRVEVWLAEPLGWMPVKLRQTEPDGTQIDLVLRNADRARTGR